MRETARTVTEGKEIALFAGGGGRRAPIVYVSLYADIGRALLDACEKLGCRPFHLVTVSRLRWDEELSPWPHGPVVTKSDHFTGEAAGYARFLEEKAIPFAESVLEPSRRIIAGYSMGGLFALYAPHVTDRFAGAVSASGSVWYPDFVPFVRTRAFLKKPEAVYLSLGDLESRRTSNPFLKQTEDQTRALFSFYQSQGIPSVFELNPGDHYTDAEYRLARGIAWILDR